MINEQELLTWPNVNLTEYRLSSFFCVFTDRSMEQTWSMQDITKKKSLNYMGT